MDLKTDELSAAGLGFGARFAGFLASTFATVSLMVLLA